MRRFILRELIFADRGHFLLHGRAWILANIFDHTKTAFAVYIFVLWISMTSCDKLVVAVMSFFFNISLSILGEPGAESWVKRKSKQLSLQERKSSLFRSCKLSRVDFLLTQLSAPGSPRIILIQPRILY